MYIVYPNNIEMLLTLPSILDLSSANFSLSSPINSNLNYTTSGFLRVRDKSGRTSIFGLLLAICVRNELPSWLLSVPRLYLSACACDPV